MWYFIEMPLHENNYEKTKFVSNIDLHFFDHLANRAKKINKEVFAIDIFQECHFMNLSIFSKI